MQQQLMAQYVSLLNEYREFVAEIQIIQFVCIIALDEGYVKFWKKTQQDAHTVPSLWRSLLSYSEENLCSMWLSGQTYAEM